MTSNYEAARRYTRRQIEDRKLVRVAVWVPPEARESVLTMAQELRQKARKRQER